MIELRDEHGRHAVQAGATLLGDGFKRRQRVEAFAGEYHAGAVSDGSEIAEHHAEAMIERHRDAQAIFRRQLHRLADEEAVVENVVMRQRRAFGKAGGPRRELDVDRLVELQLRRKLGDARRFRGAAARHHFREAQSAGVPVVAEQHDRTQRRQPRRFKFARRRMAKLGRELAQHADIVRRLELLGENERFAADFVERVFELGNAIGRIDIDQDQAGFGGGELREHPFAGVGRPDADAVAGLEAERQQSGGEPINFPLQLGISQPHFLMTHDECRPRRPSGADGIEELPDRLADQRLIAHPVDVTELERRHRGSLR